MVAGSKISLWDMSAAEQNYQAELPGDSTTDVAIIGGGYTGLSTALHCAEKGIDCHVLEAQKIGYGGSGRNGGLVNAGLWLPPADIKAQLGEDRGTALLELLGKAPEYVFSLIEKYQIQCEAVRAGTIHGAHSARSMDELAARARAWQQLGAPVELLSKDETARLIGTAVFHGGLLDLRAGTINPMGYARGLARAAVAAGARISTDAMARSLTREGDSWKIETGTGTLTSNSVILATNAYSDELWPGLNKTYTLINYFQLATVPLQERGLTILPERQGVWDTASIMSSVRRDAQNRLIIGSMGSVIGGRQGLSQRWARKMLNRLFPDLGELEIEAAWHGQIAMTPDHLPRIHKLAQGLYTPIGYNGRGIGPGTVFGRSMAELLDGGSEDSLPLPLTETKSVQFRTSKNMLMEAAFTANQLIKSI
ncbi:MAG: FAD-binding oxidoreductase [Pseudomonadota bacterium]